MTIDERLEALTQSVELLLLNSQSVERTIASLLTTSQNLVHMRTITSDGFKGLEGELAQFLRASLV